MNWGNKRVLVTGSSGLIGGPLCKLLLEKGAQVTGYDLGIVPSTLEAHGIEGKFPIVRGDILDMDALQKAVEGQEVCIHLAAVSGVEHSRELGFQAWEVNVRGTYTVLEACRRNGALQAVVGASSNHVYGKQEVSPFKETAPLNQMDTYSATKIAADAAIRSYAHNYGVRTAAVRNTNCYGVGDPHLDHIIPGTIASALRGERPVIWSTGKTKKAYLYVDDVAEAYLAIAEHIATGGPIGEAWNVSTDSISVLALARWILSATGSQLEPIVQGRASDQQDEYLDWSKMVAATGWWPKVTLGEGVRRTIDYMKSIGAVVA